ncbi:30S ribosomal protein S15 [Candidatus Aerophobetes bacterium]|nr:30S ribosomal protein S15 [Candidatus Aerophobetes bacterium]
MSISKDKKRELIEKFRCHKNDTGSSEIQIGVLSERINNLTEHLKRFKKDMSCKRGLLQLVARRRKLLDYLKREKREKYKELISTLELRR